VVSHFLWMIVLLRLLVLFLLLVLELLPANRALQSVISPVFFCSDCAGYDRERPRRKGKSGYPRLCGVCSQQEEEEEEEAKATMQCSCGTTKLRPITARNREMKGS